MNATQKIAILLFCIGLATLGFMLKLPSVFRHHDKELHALFYLGAVAFINLLFSIKNIFKHLLVSFLLFGFSVGIEFAQEYSNKFFQKRIHGRFDPEDVKANLFGLVAGSALWLVVVIITWLFKSKTKEEIED